MDTDQAEPTTELRPKPARDGVQGWLDALSSGDCDEDDFLRGVQRLTRKSPEAGWDTLSLLDQYYRLGRIPASVFNSLRESLGSELVENEADDGAVPMTRGTPVQEQSGCVQSDRARPGRAQTSRARPERTRPARAQAARTPSAQRQAPAPPHRQRQPPPRRQRQPPALRHATPPPTSARSAPAPLDQPAPGAHTTAAARAHEIELGDLLRERYEIEGVLGRGETGTVFEAADRYRLDLPGLGRQVALKVLQPPRIAGRSAWRAALQRQFQLMQSLSHPNILRTYDYDRDGDIDFFTMECLRGLSLAAVLSARNDRALDRPVALAIIRDVGAALAHAHSRSVVHGNLNPASIFITDAGEVRVLDFGAVHAPSRTPSTPSLPSDTAPRAAPRYASCQVLGGSGADARDDLYALACVAYVLLAGKHPFADQTATQAREQRLKPLRPARATAHEWRALRQGLAFDRERRAADVATWLTAFDWRKAASPLPAMAALARVSIPRPRIAWPAIVLASGALLAAGFWAIWNVDSINRAVAPAGSALSEALSGIGSSWARRWGTTHRPVTGAADGVRTEAPSAAGGDSPAAAPSAVAASPTAPTGVPAPGAATPILAARPAPGAATPILAARPAPGVATPILAARPAPGGATPTPAFAPGAVPPPAALRAAAADVAPASPSASGGVAGSHIELAADTVEVPPSDPAARVVVRRKGNLRGGASFSWWTESGTAKPEHDFIPVAPHQETIEDGKNAVNLFIPLVGDANRREPRNFYVVIDDPGSGTSLGGRTLTMVTIPPSD